MFDKKTATAYVAKIVTAVKGAGTYEAKIADLLTEAKEGNAHEALGMKSWTEYVAHVVGKIDTDSLPRVARLMLVKAMVEAGMSQRVIADALGVSQSTIRNLAAETGAKAETTTTRTGKTQSNVNRASAAKKGAATRAAKTPDTASPFGKVADVLPAILTDLSRINVKTLTPQEAKEVVAKVETALAEIKLVAEAKAVKVA